MVLLPQPNRSDDDYRTIMIGFVAAIAGYLATLFLVPVVRIMTAKRGLAGKDLCKRGLQGYVEVSIPEALGIVPATIFITAMIFCQWIYSFDPNISKEFGTASISICFIILLGFVDDVLDLRWRYKLLLPPIASIPLLLQYDGTTFVSFLVVKNGVELGWFFYVALGMLIIFSTNAINIYAGVNGLEVGQSMVLAMSILVYQLLDEINPFVFISSLIFIGTSTGVMYYNWYPASVFIGDTYCYFSGMSLAVMSIVGHLPRTYLLLLLPQIINFVLSLTQLFGVIPCPRHRLPLINTTTGLLEYSRFPCTSGQYKLFKINSLDETVPNQTIICYVLRILGPMKERSLVITLLVIQAVNSAVILMLRFLLFKNIA